MFTWGHIEVKRSATPMCPWCGGERKAGCHKCLVEGCVAERGQTFCHVTASCGNSNCRGPHFAQTNVCPGKRKAQQVAKRCTQPPEKAAGCPPAAGRRTPSAPMPERGGRGLGWRTSARQRRPRGWRSSRPQRGTARMSFFPFSLFPFFPFFWLLAVDFFFLFLIVVALFRRIEGKENGKPH